MCIAHQFIAAFRQLESIKFKIFIFLPIFWIWRPFWYEKGPIDLCFSIFFLNPREISFKLVLLTLYLSFHLKSGKNCFSLFKQHGPMQLKLLTRVRSPGFETWQFPKIIFSLFKQTDWVVQCVKSFFHKVRNLRFDSDLGKIHLFIRKKIRLNFYSTIENLIFLRINNWRLVRFNLTFESFVSVCSLA